MSTGTSNPTPETPAARRKTTVLTLAAQKRRGERIAMMTAYDYPSAKLVDRAEMEVILVGDSLAMVVLGMENTVAVTMEEMLHHCRAVARGAQRPLLVGDMPFLSYQVSAADAVQNAGRFMKEGGMDAVKLEWGAEMADTVAAIVRAGIPVMGHIGLTPQHVSRLGGFRVQGRSPEAARGLLDDALALQQAGCFAIVLEAIPAPVAAVITARLAVPTIGIGAGGGCDGQVLVFHDLLGLFDRFTARFVRQYANLADGMVAALTAYRADVKSGAFPAAEHEFTMSDADLAAFEALLQP